MGLSPGFNVAFHADPLVNGVEQIHVNPLMAIRRKSGLGSDISPFVYIITLLEVIMIALLDD